MFYFNDFDDHVRGHHYKSPQADLGGIDTTNSVADATPAAVDPIADTNFATTPNYDYQFFPEMTPKAANAKAGDESLPINSSDNPSSSPQHNNGLSVFAGTAGIAILAFGLVGLFIHRKMNSNKKKDVEMFDSNGTFDNKKSPDSPQMLQLMDTNNGVHLKETSYNISNEVNIPSLEPLSPLQLSPNNSLGAEILNDDLSLPIIPPLVFANNNSKDINSSDQSFTQPPARQSFYGESMYSTFYNTNQPVSFQDSSQSKSSFVDLSRSTAYPQSIPQDPVPFVAVSTNSNINNYENIKETVRYSIDDADVDNYNYLVESEFIRPDSFVLNDSMNSPLDEITNNPMHRELINDVAIETSVVSSALIPNINNINGQPFSENNSVYLDSENKNQSNNVYTNQNIQMDYVQPDQGTIHIETLDLNITDSTLAPAKESFEIQPNDTYDISKVTESDFNDTLSPETLVEKPNREIMKTEIVPVQSNMQIEQIQDMIEKNSENTNDPSSDTDSSLQTSETILPQMMTPATTVFVNPIQSKMKIEIVDDEPHKPFISTPSAYIAARASPFTMQSSSTPTTPLKKSSNNEPQNAPPLSSYDSETINRKDTTEMMIDSNNESTDKVQGKPKKSSLKNKGITNVDEKDRSSMEVGDSPNKVGQKKPAHRDSDQEPVPRKSILKNKVPKPQVPKMPQDLNKKYNELVAANNPVEKSEAQYRSPTFSMYKMYDDLPGVLNSTMQPDVPQLPSSKQDNIESSENDS
ncbi:36971_t:CDS:2 [Gigaspora margarita]|uniref:36971_t:CDS:1 n=1 Tax=Gigaspora margarita TaxID=4874 RepID=A0ABN7VFZ6_GIGMA|nr:36971_t:CDS:2 [Gigaspora margarita]